ncbi:MAG: ATP-binding protein, partial [Anaerolineae bacterium]
TTFSANELVDGVVNVVTPMAKQNQNKIVIQNRLTTKAEDLICTDEIKLNQILLNIVSNAVKYTQNGAIYINLERDGDSAIFKVVDSGIGIAESHLAIIFNPFEQIENSYSRRFSGSGLGLTISKRLIDLLSGEIEVESQLGHGSTFSIRIPVGVRDSKKITTEIDF